MQHIIQNYSIVCKQSIEENITTLVRAGIRKLENYQYISEPDAVTLANLIMSIEEESYDPASGAKLLADNWSFLVKDPNYFVVRQSHGNDQQFYVLENERIMGFFFNRI